MDDRLYEDLGITPSSYSDEITDQCTRLAYDDYYEEEEDETGGDYEDDEEEEEDNPSEKEAKLEELACPFCTEDFDVLGLCCHIDAEHRMEVKSGICPFCCTKVRINMASHIITQHENTSKALCAKKKCNVRSRSLLLVLRNDLREKHLRYLKEFHSVDSSSDVATDSKLLLFVNNPHHSCRPQTSNSASSTQASISVKSSNGDLSERIQHDSSTDRNNEKMRKCEFSQGLILSTIFDDL